MLFKTFTVDVRVYLYYILTTGQGGRKLHGPKEESGKPNVTQNNKDSLKEHWFVFCDHYKKQVYFPSLWLCGIPNAKKLLKDLSLFVNFAVNLSLG